MLTTTAVEAALVRPARLVAVAVMVWAVPGSAPAARASVSTDQLPTLVAVVVATRVTPS